MATTKFNLLVIVALLSIQSHLQILPTFIEAARSNNVHIVYMGQKKHEDPTATKMSHQKMLSNLLGSKEAARNSMLYSYRHGFSGFAARLTESQAEEIAAFPGVVQVIPNRIHKLHTTRSWEFMGLNFHSSKNLLAQSNLGEGTIIGVIDSGIWPESESFNDRGMAQIPSRWKGTCREGQMFNSSNCNRKLIGARWFIKGILDQFEKPINISSIGEEFLSARDSSGHGTHTSSTAAGNFVENANYHGLAAGLARGGAPRAHLAVYKACWAFETEGCTDADLLKAFDKAIHDGVDILSVSIGNSIPLFSYVDQRNSIAIGSFHATEKGITIACSAGNDGPTAMTVENTAPWVITVAATTIDRAFPTAITLGNNLTLWGQSVDTRIKNNGFTGITYSDRIAVNSSDNSAQDCQRGSLNATLAAGKIILCFSQSGTQDIFSAAISVLEAGGIGLIFAQHRSDGLTSCLYIPCIKVDYEVGTQILSYIRKARSPIAKLSIPKTIIGKWASPRVADFSSRGPSSISPVVLKPDIAAPGVDILAAYIPGSKEKRSGYRFLSGTSMSCPHVAGIAALIKSVHKSWSSAAIRSALVTTASQTWTDGSNIAEEGSTRKAADPFDIGSGLVNPNKAIDPGLVYDAGIEDYIHFLCGSGYSSKSLSALTHSKINCTKSKLNVLNLNLPSITIPHLRRKVTVTRTVTNVGPVDSVYDAKVEAPHGIKMKVEPQTLSFNKTTKILAFKVTFISTLKGYAGDYRFGSLIWTNGKHVVRSPVSVRAVLFEPYTDV